MKELLDFLIFTPEVVERVVVLHPKILDQPAGKVTEMIQVIVEMSDFHISPAEAINALARCPEILSLSVSSLREIISNMFFTTSLYDLPWNMVIVAEPRSVLLDAEYVRSFLVRLEEFFSHEHIRNLIGNNPDIFFVNWDEIERKMKFLQQTMNVSAYRVSMTPKSLTLPFDSLEARYNFLVLTGNYRHPECNQKSAIPMEASPMLHHITDTSDEKFVLSHVPGGVNMEEWEAFLCLRKLSRHNEMEGGEEDGDDSDSEDRFTYKSIKTRKKETSRSLQKF